jgi:hypothetical protein
MKSVLSVLTAVFAVVAILAIGPAQAGEQEVQFAANVTGDDRAVAADCLAKLRTDGAEDTVAFLDRLAREDYVLTSVRLVERRSEPDRVRLGYSFANRLVVVNVYMEADCPAAVADPYLPAQSAKAASGK